MSLPRVFVVHNRYGSETPSGENTAVDQEIAILRRAGVTVGSFITSSDMWRERGLQGQVGAALSSIWNPVMINRACSEAASFKPDIIHVHNTYPTYSNFIFQSLNRIAPVVLTLHNFRLLCAAGTPMRAGKPCLLCIEKGSVRPALQYGCYMNSFLRTLPLAVGITIHRLRETWSRDVNGLICFTHYHRDLFAQAGFPVERLFVKPNGYLSEIVPLDTHLRHRSVVFMGRLSVEKGVEQLVRAWLALSPSDLTLRIVGNGPLRPLLESLSNKPESGISFTGTLDHAAAIDELRTASAVLVPSTTIEGFPMVLAEACAAGTPALVSNVGPLPAIVQTGGFGEALDFADLSAFLSALSSVTNAERWKQYHENAVSYFRQEISGSSNVSRLLDIYSRITGTLV